MKHTILFIVIVIILTIAQFFIRQNQESLENRLLNQLDSTSDRELMEDLPW